MEKGFKGTSLAFHSSGGSVEMFMKWGYSRAIPLKWGYSRPILTQLVVLVCTSMTRQVKSLNQIGSLPPKLIRLLSTFAQGQTGDHTCDEHCV